MTFPKIDAEEKMSMMDELALQKIWNKIAYAKGTDKLKSIWEWWGVGLGEFLFDQVQDQFSSMFMDLEQ